MIGREGGKLTFNVWQEQRDDEQQSGYQGGDEWSSDTAGSLPARKMGDQGTVSVTVDEVEVK